MVARNITNTILSSIDKVACLIEVKGWILLQKYLSVRQLMQNLLYLSILLRIEFIQRGATKEGLFGTAVKTMRDVSNLEIHSNSARLRPGCKHFKVFYISNETF
jgi:hypothetical protein